MEQNNIDVHQQKFLLCVSFSMKFMWRPVGDRVHSVHIPVLSLPAHTVSYLAMLTERGKGTIMYLPCQLVVIFQIGPSGCVRCHGNKVSTINGVIFSLFSPPGYFSPRRVYGRVP